MAPDHTVTTGIFAIYPIVVVAALICFGDISVAIWVVPRPPAFNSPDRKARGQERPAALASSTDPQIFVDGVLFRRLTGSLLARQIRRQILHSRLSMSDGRLRPRGHALGGGRRRRRRLLLRGGIGGH
jgi:hypothetical protein